MRSLILGALAFVTMGIMGCAHYICHPHQTVLYKYNEGTHQYDRVEFNYCE